MGNVNMCLHQSISSRKCIHMENVNTCVHQSIRNLVYSWRICLLIAEIPTPSGRISSRKLSFTGSLVIRLYLYATTLVASLRFASASTFHNTSKISLVMGFAPREGGERGSAFAPALGVVLDLGREPPAKASWMGLSVNSVARGDMISSGMKASDRGRGAKASFMFIGCPGNSVVRGEKRADSARLEVVVDIGSLAGRRCVDDEGFDEDDLLVEDDEGLEDVEGECFELDEVEYFELVDVVDLEFEIGCGFDDEEGRLSVFELASLDDAGAKRCGICPPIVPVVGSRGEVNPMVKVSPTSDCLSAVIPNSVDLGVAKGSVNMLCVTTANLSSLGEVMPNERSSSF